MSCGCVYVIERPSTGGSQTLSYDGANKNLSISGGNTVTVNENQLLQYDSSTNLLSLTDGLSNIISSITINSPILYDVGYWTIYRDELNNQISFFINETYTLLSSPTYGSVYLLFPYILTGKYNTYFSAEYSGGSHSSIFENQYKSLAYMGLDTYTRNGTTLKFSVPVSFRCEGLADFTKNTIYVLSENLGLGTIAAGSYVMTTFSTPAVYSFNSDFYVQPKFTSVFAGSFNFDLYDDDNSTVIATSNTIGFPSSTIDFAELSRNLPMTIPCENLMNAVTNYSIRMNVIGGSVSINTVGVAVLGDINQ
jgi:hypothetical protein